MRSSVWGGLKFCAIYIVFVILMLTLAYLSADERISGLLTMLAWLPGGFTLLGTMWLFGLHYLPVEGLEVGPLLAVASILTVFLVGLAFTAIKNRVS